MSGSRRDRIRTFLRFLIAGGTNTAVTYGIYLLLLWLQADRQVAFAAAFVSGIVIAYALNAMFVFRRRMAARSFAMFPIVYLAQYVAGAAVLELLVKVGHVPQTIAPLAVAAITVPVTFALSRWVIVRPEEPIASGAPAAAHGSHETLPASSRKPATERGKQGFFARCRLP